jgi:hypothetical protein
VCSSDVALFCGQRKTLIFCENDTTQSNTGPALIVLVSLHDSFPSLDHDNRSSYVVPQIEVTGTRQNTSVSVNMILALAPSTVTEDRIKVC